MQTNPSSQSCEPVLECTLPFLESGLRCVAACAIIATSVFGVLTPPNAVAGEAALFGGTIYYSGSQAELDQIKAAGFTTAILWTIHVDGNGDLNLSGNPMVTDGVYVGDAAWPARFQTLKKFPSTINRVEIAVGAWGSAAFDNIRNQINAYGTGPSTRLYRNFQKLKEVTGADAINDDDELTYDVNSTVAFGNMLSNMGYRFTLCPYTNSGFWQQVKSQLGSRVDRVYLQCYDGGAGNNPATWNSYFGGMKVMPGVWGRHYNNSAGDDPATVASKMNSWKASAGITGGFYWMGDDLYNAPQNGTYAQYGTAIQSALGGTFAGTYNLINRNSNLALDASGAGTANGTPLIQSLFHGNSNQQWRLGHTSTGQFNLMGVGSGRAIDVYGAVTNDNAGVVIHDWNSGNNQKITLQDRGGGYYSPVFAHSGKALSVLNNATNAGASVVQFTNNGATSSQWRFQATVAPGTYFLQARHTGLVLDASGAGTANGTPLIQSFYHGGNNQRWNVSALGSGQYSMTGVASGRAVDVYGAVTNDNAGLVIHDWNGGNNQKFTLVDQGDGWFSVVFVHSGKAMEVQNSSTASGASVVQYTLNAHGYNAQWAFRAPY